MNESKTDRDFWRQLALERYRELIQTSRTSERWRKTSLITSIALVIAFALGSYNAYMRGRAEAQCVELSK